MAQWVRREYSKADIDRAGALLIPWWKREVNDPPESGRSYMIIENWRTSHARPLLTFRVGLERRAKRVDTKSLVAQRLKRFSSVMNKLVREPTMKLSQMQDLGGCRAIVSQIGDVDRLYELYRESPELFGEGALKCDDYIRKPKSDGYRGIHVIGRFEGHAKNTEAWNGQRIEIQLRSQLQHAFATSVETVTTFTREPLKFGAGPEEWRRFFSLVGSAFASRENTPLVAGMPLEKNEILRELSELTKSLRVRQRLQGWTSAMTKLRSRNIRKAKWLLLVLNVPRNTISIIGYVDRAKAREELSKIEKASRASELDAVLVWVGSISYLRRAYPNYFADTKAFLEALNSVLKEATGEAL
ncbi:MAG: hypothetical protein A2170_02735 [Deltaproteobacteria bacterium RBG_13_53_10]|nr:MAG: hypothetical protein A2170_02735 [Deltaproteobacteria bacterium RBG_13_53_10]